MGHVLSDLVRAMGVAADRLDQSSVMPWPLLLGLLVPVFAAAVSLFWWLIRGTLRLVPCGYPLAGRYHPCQNRVRGEWRRCPSHRTRRTLRAAASTVSRPPLRRWETITADGAVVDNPQVRGVGLSRWRMCRDSVLYHRGFAVRPHEAWRAVPTWWRHTRGRAADLYDLFAGVHGDASLEAQGARVNEPTRERSRIAGHAVRVTVGLLVASLAVTGVALLLPGGSAHALNFVAALGMMAMWAAAYEGVWLGERHWVRLMGSHLRQWGGAFVVLTVVAGTLAT